MSWSPLLTGSLLRDAWDAIEAIALDVARPRLNPVSGLERAYPHSLAYGSAGVALFYGYLGQAAGDGVAMEASRSCIELSLAAMGRHRMVPDLFRGFAGITWVYEHLRGSLWLAGDESEDSAVVVDSALERWMANEAVPSELMNGCGGVCLYAIERLPRPTAHRLLVCAVRRLQELAIHFRSGCAWPLGPHFARAYLADQERAAQEGRALLEPEDLRRAGHTGVFKLGPAHGVSGIAACLAAATVHLDPSDAPRETVVEALTWLLAQELADNDWSLFPELAGSSRLQHSSGWCNGDLGIAGAVFTAAEVLEGSSFRSEALRIARHQAKLTIKDIETFNRASPILCHGHAGRAHIFNRLYQATGETLFRDVALYWYKALLELRSPGMGYGGFSVDEDGEQLDLHTFLMGSAGIGLALLAACTSVVPAWDRVLALSLPTAADRAKG